MRTRAEIESKRALALVAGAAVVVAFSVYSAHVLFGLGGGEVSDFYDHWLSVAIIFAGAFLCLLRAARTTEQRLGWALVGLGLFAFATGELDWTEVLSDRSAEATFPSGADAGHFVYYPLTLAGIVLIVSDRLRNRPRGLWLDAAAVALAVASIGSAIVIETFSEGLGSEFGALFEGLGYPAADLLMLAFLAAILVLCGQRPGFPVGLLAGGVATIAIADAAYSYELSQGIYTEASALNVLWPLAALLVGLAACAPASEPVTVRPAAGRRNLVVAGAVGSAAIAGYAYARIGGGDPLTEALLLLTIFAVLARLTFAFAENQRLTVEVSHDPLTGLANRGQLELDLREAIWEGPGPSTLCLLDLDGFKAYNDSFGHPAGDELLVRLASRFAAATGERGRAYRVGGDEFCVLLRGNLDSVGVFISRARAAFSEAGSGFEVSNSIGCVELPREAPSPEAAIQLADRRMYEDKLNSRVSASEQAVAVLARAQSERTPELASHTRDVAELAVEVARHVGIDASQLALVKRAAELHDIGKVAIPDAILDKPSALTDDERAFVRRHSLIGERILASAPDLLPVARIVRSSHERFDGGGYPDGLSGDQIPIAARIIFVCDAFSAMTSPRPYAKAKTPREALVELRRCSGSQFDPDVVHAFGQALARGGPELARDDAGESRDLPSLGPGPLVPSTDRPSG